jgi:hypothetical protein
MNHSVNLVMTAGVIVFDDRGQCVQVLRFPFLTLFFKLPAAVYAWIWQRLIWGRLAVPAPIRKAPKRLRRRLAGDLQALIVDLAELQRIMLLLVLRWKMILLAYLWTPQEFWRSTYA